VRTTHDGGQTWEKPVGLSCRRCSRAKAPCGERHLPDRRQGLPVRLVRHRRRAVSRVFRTHNRGQAWNSSTNPIPAGNASSGLFSVAFLDEKRGFVAGGDYKQPQFAGLNGVRTQDGGRTWRPAPIMATGFMSAVVAIPGTTNDLVAAGLAGEAISHDAGRPWTPIGDAPVNAVAFADAHTGWAVGPKGTILRYTVPAR
jgi:photosystem II stability/assembly factor-like uncharacterized protein